MASFPNLPCDVTDSPCGCHVGSDRVTVGETDAGRHRHSATISTSGETERSATRAVEGPDVKLCALDHFRRAKNCATFAYQWVHRFDQRQRLELAGNVKAERASPDGRRRILTAR